MEDVIAPDVRRWSGKHAQSPHMPPGGGPMDRVFKCPEEPLHTSYAGERASPPLHRQAKK